MVGLCGGVGASLAAVIMRSHSCALAVCVVESWHGHRLYLSHSITIPSGRWRFCCHSSGERIHFWGTSKPVWTLKKPPYSNHSSKDRGYSDCQLGVPTSPIRSQRKIDFSKGDREESAVLWRVLKHFMPLDYNATIFLPLALVFEGQTVILKGVTHLWVVRCWGWVPFDDTF